MLNALTTAVATLSSTPLQVRLEPLTIKELDLSNQTVLHH